MNARYRPQGRQARALRPHAQRLRRRGRPRADRGDGNLPAGGRLDRGARRAAALYGRHEERSSEGRMIDAHPRHQRRRHPCRRARRLRGDRARARPTTSGWSRPNSTSPASRIRSRSTIRCGCARSAERHFAVKGTPTDCVIMGVRHIVLKDAARPRPLRRQSRPQRRRGRDLFRHRRRRDGRRRARHSVDRAVAGLQLGAASSRRIGTPRAASRPTSSGACSRPASRATCWSTSIFRIARRTRCRASR